MRLEHEDSVGQGEEIWGNSTEENRALLVENAIKSTVLRHIVPDIFVKAKEFVADEKQFKRIINKSYGFLARIGEAPPLSELHESANSIAKHPLEEVSGLVAAYISGFMVRKSFDRRI